MAIGRGGGRFSGIEMSLRANLDRESYVWFRGALGEDVLAELDEAADMDSRIGERAAPHGKLDRALRQSKDLRALLSELGYLPDPLRIVSFDKSEEANWALPWHQDRVVALRERLDVAGYTNWSRKAGIWHCEPPIALPEKMVFVRIHLDDCDADNGCLQLAPRSDRLGRVSAGEAITYGQQARALNCTAKRGDVLVVKALTLHRSDASASASRRRAIRVDYSSVGLPVPLEWAFDLAN